MKSEANQNGWRVSAEDEGERLDRFLVPRLGEWSRSKLQGFIKEGRVRIDGIEQRKVGTILIAGAVVAADLPERHPKASPEQARRELEVLHEDEDLLVVNKPAGLLTHRREAGLELSLAELALAHCGELPSPQGEDRPGIVHRLDRETSGVIVLAKNVASVEGLMKQFRGREVKKTYAVLVSGKPRFKSDWIEDPLGRDPRRPDRISVLAEEDGGRAASTYYEVQELLGGFTFMHCMPRTGRTHQIRVHMNVAGMDVLGDKTYWLRNSRNPRLPATAPRAQRQMLHAMKLELLHPRTRESMGFVAPLPDDFQGLLDWLRLHP